MQTIELLDKAVRHSKSERALSIELGLDPSALAVARKRGKLSTSLAIVLAAHEGEDVAKWAIQAEEENEKSEPLRRSLVAIKRAITNRIS